MKPLSRILLYLAVPIALTSCFEDLDDQPIANVDINDFVYKAMDVYYLYKEDVPVLVEDKVSSADYNNYLSQYSRPQELFESLIYNRTTIDRFSWITDDYLALEQQFSGITTTTGMEFGLVRYASGSNDIYGYVRYILPNTSAESAGLQRGDLFYAVNGTPLTVSNYRRLLGQYSFTLNLAEYNDNTTTTPDDDTIDPTINTIDLNTVSYTENPVFKTDVLQVEGENVGYLMYNGFVANFNDALSAAFGVFKGNAVQHLVVDLRYNPGGSVTSAALLGSLITGDFNGDIFSKLQYNYQLQSNNTSYNFTSQGNSLNLNTVYVLTSKSSASASEMVINSLKPYITVVQVGAITTGKSQASITLYDSPDFGRINADPRHTYALQPLVATTVNVLDEGVPSTGLVPLVEYDEQLNNLGILGTETEPLLAEALNHISNTNRTANTTEGKSFEAVGDSNDLVPFSKEMYID
ncbi:peptidase S41 [Bizionia gelidisalsuginis]|uniref:Peptidase S41 n=1 Tax=Bizionia gelidisalsuginis TaxID=291188 RepID=A0ABY3ME84_9FLAO|nr:S41 family peptidase [Bizionia gelidisalsuginis]TYC17907.1 peptidase S41 [Bizionia gelidisalsuginis]